MFPIKIDNFENEQKMNKKKNYESISSSGSPVKRQRLQFMSKSKSMWKSSKSLKFSETKSVRSKEGAKAVKLEDYMRSKSAARLARLPKPQPIPLEQKVNPDYNFAKEREKLDKRKKGEAIKEMFKKNKFVAVLSPLNSKEAQLREKQLSTARLNNSIITTDSSGKLLIAKKPKLEKPPKTLSDTSTVFELKAGSQKGANLFKAIYMAFDNKPESTEDKTKSKQNNDNLKPDDSKEIDEEELEREFERNKKKFIPKIHQFQMLFERKGFVGSDKMKEVIKREVALTERGSRYTKTEDEESPQR